jgi:nicotinate-nucleotide pyrophosphorylase
MGLYDMILLKDNHVDFAGGIARAIAATRQYLQDKKLNLKIEIEVRSLDELEQVLQCGGVDRIMLDNFDPGTTRKAVERIAGSYETNLRAVSPSILSGLCRMRGGFYFGGRPHPLGSKPGYVVQGRL